MEQMPGEQQPNFCSHHHSVTTPALWVLSGRLRVTGLAEDKDSRGMLLSDVRFVMVCGCPRNGVGLVNHIAGSQIGI